MNRNSFLNTLSNLDVF